MVNTCLHAICLLLFTEETVSRSNGFSFQSTGLRVSLSLFLSLSLSLSLGPVPSSNHRVGKALESLPRPGKHSYRSRVTAQLVPSMTTLLLVEGENRLRLLVDRRSRFPAGNLFSFHPGSEIAEFIPWYCFMLSNVHMAVQYSLSLKD